jgi:hypothetical protein
MCPQKPSTPMLLMIKLNPNVPNQKAISIKAALASEKPHSQVFVASPKSRAVDLIPTNASSSLSL